MDGSRMPDDSHLRHSFEELRKREAAEAPSFHSVRARTVKRTSARVFLAAAAVLLVVTLSLVIGSRRQPSPASQPAVSTVPITAVSRPAPTDFLLQTPQRNLLRTVPKFGETHPFSTKGAS